METATIKTAMAALGLKKFYTVAEVAEATTLSLSFLYSAMGRKELGFTKAGRRRMISAEALEKFLAARTVEA